LIELRRYERAPLDVNLEFTTKGSDNRIAGRAKDISLGGMFVLTAQPPAFGAEVIIQVTLPGQKAPFALPGVVRWCRPDGMGVQFGNLGARETHAITELTAQGREP
jgi:uncharacterized protein (TIGR02266 family)